MKYVDFYKLQNDGSQNIVLRCLLDANNTITFEGPDTVLAENIKTQGIKDYEAKKSRQLFPADGLSFLQNLSHNFKSDYLNASAVKE